jgi:hypothetical protein
MQPPFFRKEACLGISLTGIGHIGGLAGGSHSHKAGTLHVPIVPMSVKVPLAASMVYIETLFDPEFVTWANFPDG